MGTEIAQAYVHIIPSAKGIKGNLQGVLDPEAQKAGQSSGGLLGSTLVGKLKGIIATAGIGKVLGDTLMSGADLQQSLGGIETLFKGSADKVKQYADQAYKTVGLSSNDYMEQVTSFSASLLQSLGGDTAKAAESANMAMIDMGDNANKMGTDMESIQNAYQGFAKQNYTMLDNLKLGYGGTQSEMQRLLADAEKISGVHYDMSNLNDVYSAIHVIQGELGITGTTAKEASETFSGSFAAMKASISNLMGNLSLGQDIRPSLEQLKSTVSTFLFGNLIPMLGNIITALPTLIVGLGELGYNLATTVLNAITTQGPSMLMKGMEMLQKFVEGFIMAFPSLIATAIQGVNNFLVSVTSMLPQVLSKGTEIIVNLVTGILESLPDIVTSATTSVNGFMSQIVSMLPQILSEGGEMLIQLAQGILANLPNIVVSAIESVSSFIHTIGNNLPLILEQGITMIGKLAAGLIQAIPNLVAQIPKIIKAIIDVFLHTDWLSVGKNIIQGIANGLKNAGHLLWESVKGILGNFKDKVLEFFGIHSPARWGVFVGEMVDKGIANGLSDVRPIDKAVESVKNAISTPITAKALLDTSVINPRVTRATTKSDESLYWLKRIAENGNNISINVDDREIGRLLKGMGVTFA